MDLEQTLADDACVSYQKLIYGNPRFVDYFRQATPEADLSTLNIGSRPSKRKTGGIETLRAIPWMFAWTQNRLNLPVWLGVGTALVAQIEKGNLDVLQRMAKEWPFFSSTMELISMVLEKSDARIVKLYNDTLVDESLQELATVVEGLLKECQETVLKVMDFDNLLESQPVLARAWKSRKPYIDPLNMIQVETLRKKRQEETCTPVVEDTLKVCIQALAAGMQSTG